MSRSPASICAVAGGSSGADDCRGLARLAAAVGVRVIVRREKT